MLDLKKLRENPEVFDAGWRRRGLPLQTENILSLDKTHRTHLTEMEVLQAQINALSKQIGQKKAQGQDVEQLKGEVTVCKKRLVQHETEEEHKAQALRSLLDGLPNIPDASVPDGKGEEDNQEVRRIGQPRALPRARDHVDLGYAVEGMDFESAARMSGARFVLLKGPLARLERALAQFMLDTHTQEHGYTEVSPPLLVRSEALYGTGQLPKFEEDMFKTTTGHYLISTSEISLTNTLLDTIVDAADLPLRLTGLTPCFRSEAGAAGKDTRGMIRQHQFYKVEMVSITSEDQSAGELERMTACAESILKKLDLPFRTILLCSGDMGFASCKTYDLEVWLPGQNAYREISSCSNCGDFQARRMRARYKTGGEKGTRYVHTLNGSGVAVGRCLVAIMENYQQADGSIVIPDVLQSYMGGLTRIEIPQKVMMKGAARA